MNLMSVDIPSAIMGESWGRIVLIVSASYVQEFDSLPVLVYLDQDVVLKTKLSMLEGALDDILYSHLGEEWQWLIYAQLALPERVGYGVREFSEPIRNVRGAMRSLALMIGKSIDAEVLAALPNR